MKQLPQEEFGVWVVAEMGKLVEVGLHHCSKYKCLFSHECYSFLPSVQVLKMSPCVSLYVLKQKTLQPPTLTSAPPKHILGISEYKQHT